MVATRYLDTYADKVCIIDHISVAGCQLISHRTEELIYSAILVEPKTRLTESMFVVLVVQKLVTEFEIQNKFPVYKLEKIPFRNLV